jgi:hypothetical protein
MTGPRNLAVRRSRLLAGLNAALALAVVIGAAWYLHAHFADADAPWVGAAMVAVLIGYQVWHNIRHILDPTPVVTVGPEGLGLPQNADAPIPWSAISRVGAARGFAMIGGGRLDVELLPEAFAHVRLGKRLMGDPVVKMPALPYGISIVAQGLDHRASDMLAAIETHWPPSTPGGAADADRED